MKCSHGPEFTGLHTILRISGTWFCYSYRTAGRLSLDRITALIWTQLWNAVVYTITSVIKPQQQQASPVMKHCFGLEIGDNARDNGNVVLLEGGYLFSYGACNRSTYLLWRYCSSLKSATSFLPADTRLQLRKKSKVLCSPCGKGPYQSKSEFLFWQCCYEYIESFN